VVAVINVSVINGLVFNSSHFSEVDGLQLMAISKIGMVCCDNFIIIIISFSSQNLMLGSSFEMMRSLTVMISGCVMNVMFVFGDF
jgi:hypothetical protein